VASGRQRLEVFSPAASVARWRRAINTILADAGQLAPA
jgi:hypothetical protein